VAAENETERKINKKHWETMSKRYVGKKRARDRGKEKRQLERNTIRNRDKQERHK
jgi:hypothetical protein